MPNKNIPAVLVLTQLNQYCDGAYMAIATHPLLHQDWFSPSSIASWTPWTYRAVALVAQSASSIVYS